MADAVNSFGLGGIIMADAMNSFGLGRIIMADTVNSFGLGGIIMADAVNSTRGTGFATPFLRFKVSKVIEAFKRFGRGYKPRPASGYPSVSNDEQQTKTQRFLV